MRRSSIENADLARRFHGARVAVTGAGGLIGGALATAFLMADVPVVALDVRDMAGRDARLSMVRVDIRHREALTRALAGADYVFHQAGWKVPSSDRDPSAAIEVLVQGTLNVAAACAATDAKLLLASTGSIYGDGQSGLFPEDQPIRCDSFYAAGKAAAEHLLEAAGHRWNLKYVSLRYFSVYGPEMTIDGPDVEVLGRWASQIIRGQRPVVHGDGRQLRDFTHVADVVQANLRAALCGAAGSAYNVGTGTGIALADAAALLIRVAGSSGEPEIRPDRPGGNQCSVPTIDKARTELGYRPLISRAAGFAELFGWIRGQLTDAVAQGADADSGRM